MRQAPIPYQVPPINNDQLNDLINIVHHLYGFDFSHYAEASLKRQVSKFMHLQQVNYFDLRNRLVNDSAFFESFLLKVTVNVTEMFRDPDFYKAIRTQVLPYLNSYPRINLWSAGCSTGEEIYSFAILFQEENLYNRSSFYGTDINMDVLKIAETGIYALPKMKQYAENFRATGALNSFSDYYTSKYDAASIHHSLKKNMVFFSHNLVSDDVFNAFQVISCRNVLIYFDRDLQDRVIELFYRSLAPFGFLCLGSKETIRNTGLKQKFKIIDKKNNIYQRKD